MYTADQIADWFLSKTDSEKGDVISHLKLQKLVYYAQAWHYTVFGEPLFNERIEAWKNGPVIPSLYYRFKSITKHSGIDTSGIVKPGIGTKSEELLNEVFDIYGEHSGSYLEDLTHRESPWKDARGNLPVYAACNNVITLEAMRSYYSAING